MPRHCPSRAAAGPRFEAERALRHQHLEAVERARAGATRGGEQRGRSTPINHVDDIRVLTDQIERQRQLVELRDVSGRGF
jgi:hypothetical protein